MYDVIVIGGGHAGSEACLASARKGHKTLLITGNINMIASMPCNPSVGGPAKGIVIREIDALGGEMGRVADKTQIQMRMLNISKGPAVQALRAQSDKVAYSNTMRDTILNQDNLDVVEAYVKELHMINDEIKGVELESGEVILGSKFIITTGTFMEAKVMVGDDIKLSGPDKQKPSLGLSPQLRELGFETQRLKTGTPPRIKTGSVDFSKTVEHPGDLEERCFSYDNIYYFDVNKQWPCYLTYTAPSTHEVILNNLELSSMYSGVVEGVGPRYCPSIEDKLVRFKDKERHQLFLEPESVTLDEIYVQGFSTSLPYHVQDEMIRTIPGLENAEIVKYAYAIEYDAIDPRDLYASLASKKYPNLYFAGQVNGTSGYEEAACQGLIAGINASLDLEGKDPIVLKRHEAYIGVLIDDLVTKGVKDPYRLLTSRAEYRLLLRHDNADIRLREYGYQVGLVDEKRYASYNEKLNQIAQLKNELKVYEVTPNKAINAFMEKVGSTAIRNKTTLYDLVRRPELTINKLAEFVDLTNYSKEAIEQTEIDIKYEGYIKKAMKQADKMLKMEHYKIPSNINYDDVNNLAYEAKEKLKSIRPMTIGQASRISGVNPADISILLVYIQSKNSSN